MQQTHYSCIVLGVTGSIAAYKTPELVRALRAGGASVRTVLTEGGAAFITPLSLQAVSGEPVHRHLLDADREAAMGHIELARWADAVLVAPASADMLAKYANGLADDLLSALLLATDAPVFVAPAMNLQMWQHPAVRDNLARLQSRGVTVLGPGEGAQACGEHGEGRMLEPAEIAARLMPALEPCLAGCRVLITAGPTWEALDPVRGLSNRSSGKMGYALAEAARQLGAEACLISGPVALAPPVGVPCIPVESAEQMHAAVMDRLSGLSLFIGCAAVADYRPKTQAEQKIKKQGAPMSVDLVPNPDILADVAARPDPPVTLGFAAETERHEEQAAAKREAKGADFIAVNNVGGEDSVLGKDHTALTLIDEAGAHALSPGTKRDAALELLQRVAPMVQARSR